MNLVFETSEGQEVVGEIIEKSNHGDCAYGKVLNQKDAFFVASMSHWTRKRPWHGHIVTSEKEAKASFELDKWKMS